MIKQMITATLITSAPLNSYINTSQRASTYLSADANIYSNEVYDNDDNLESGQYYRVLLAGQTLRYKGGYISVRGLQYFNIDNTQLDENQQIAGGGTGYIDIYILANGFEQNAQTPYEFVDFDITLLGQFNENGPVNCNYEDYNLSYINTNNEALNSFIGGGTNFTYNQLEQIKNLNTWSVIGNSDYENNIYDDYANLIPEELHKYYRWRLEMNYDVTGIMIPQNAFNTVATVYNQINVVYDYTVPSGPQTTEVVDIPGLMFEILGMPFAWINTAFNLTIFPGTPYSVNISHVFMAVIASLILVIVLKKILK